MIESLPDRFTWTHWRDYGPDESLLRLQPGHRVLDLGCGRGTHLAYLCRSYRMHGVGIDRDPDLVSAARTYFRGGTAEFVQDEALAYLARCSVSSVDAVYSRFGAVWFTDPDQLLPTISDRLRPGGRLVFSHVAPGFREFDVPRWDDTSQVWCDRLADLGFSELHAVVLPCRGNCRYTPCPGVMIVEGTR